jgi:hypothetical protein
MADPLSILAIVALAFAGQKISAQQSEPIGTPKDEFTEQTEKDDSRTVLLNNFTGSVLSDPGFGSFGVPQKSKYEQPSFGDISPDVTFVNGMPVQDFRDRPWISGQMNNLAPMEKVMVGPGLGVDPNVPAIGGYQQVYRVLPNNVGAYRLTTLPGRAGPRNGTITGGAAPTAGTWGEVGHNRPEKTVYLPDRRAPTRGKAAEMNGVTVREHYEKGKRLTNRSETGLRNDTLSTAPAKRLVGKGTLAQDPTRNKADLSTEQFSYVNNPSPGIHSFVGAYNTAPNDIRVADKRGHADRMGNPGRMNVRASPVNAQGMITASRQLLGAQNINARNGGWTQQYVAPMFQSNNPYKGTQNPWASSNVLNTAKNQLKNNPLAQTFSV